jgi:hypothetical protein
MPLIIKAGEEISETYNKWFGDDEPANIDGPITKKSDRKKHDTTRLTKYQFDFIMEAHRQYVAHNLSAVKGGRITQQDLAKTVNEKMGTHKSVSTLALVWNGKLDRDSLADGTAYFDY